MTKIWYFLVIVLYLNLCNGQEPVHEEPINGESGCLVCSKESGMKCISKTRHVSCIQGSTTTYTCENGTVCTNGVNVCSKKVDVAYPIKMCNRGCGICDEQRRHACISKESYSLCFDKVTPAANNVFACPPHTFCSTVLESINGKLCHSIANYSILHADCGDGDTKPNQ